MRNAAAQVCSTGLKALLTRFTVQPGPAAFRKDCLAAQLIKSSSMSAQSMSPLVKLLLASLAMAVVPLSLLYAVLQGKFDTILHNLTGADMEVWRSVLAAIVAVLGVNMVVGGFIVVAFREPVPPPAKKTQ